MAALVNLTSKTSQLSVNVFIKPEVFHQTAALGSAKVKALLVRVYCFASPLVVVRCSSTVANLSKQAVHLVRHVGQFFFTSRRSPRFFSGKLYFAYSAFNEPVFKRVESVLNGVQVIESCILLVFGKFFVGLAVLKVTGIFKQRIKSAKQISLPVLLGLQTNALGFLCFSFKRIKPLLYER